MALVKSFLPTMVSCKHCGQKLRYADAGAVTVVGMVIAALISIPAGCFAGDYMFEGEFTTALLILLALVAVGILFEVIFGLYLRSKKQLVRRD